MLKGNVSSSMKICTLVLLMDLPPKLISNSNHKQGNLCGGANEVQPLLLRQLRKYIFTCRVRKNGRTITECSKFDIYDETLKSISDSKTSKACVQVLKN